MRVLHLSKFHLAGGAGVAAARLNRALRKNGIESDLLVDQLSETENHVHELSNTYFRKKTLWIRFVLERLFFLFYERSPEIRFAFSPARFGTDVTDHPLFKKAEIIHVFY